MASDVIADNPTTVENGTGKSRGWVWGWQDPVAAGVVLCALIMERYVFGLSFASGYLAVSIFAMTRK